MKYEPGERYDCNVCGGTHVVERGKELRVAGASEGLDPALYVRCPEVGFRSLSGPGATDAGVDAPDDPDDESDAGDRDWP